METSCVRVPLASGEATRTDLAERDLIATELQITSDEDHLYVPVTNPDAVPQKYEITTREVPPRETQTMPADLLEDDTSYERLGDVVILDEDDGERASVIADAVLSSDLPVSAVLNKASKVKGERRVRDWAVIATRDDVEDPTVTTHREYGCEYHLDLSEVYFSPRLATERHRVAELVAADERAFDMFAGVGPFTIPFAKRGAAVVATDINPTAVEYLRENIRRNDVADRVTAIEGDVRPIVDGRTGPRPEGFVDWADRIVMNLPHRAASFLETAVTLAGTDCVLHYYDIQPDSDPFGPGRRAIKDAADESYEMTVLNERHVRSYAPHEVNVCLDVRLTR